MSIQALPLATARIIGSLQVLSDPSSVVKELIDNALDARATSVFVEVSVNTLDLIQVRDNGHGIAPDDRGVVCRRYHTSKIRHYSDIKAVGGKWLGFRGEALASVAELSGNLSITTRIEGEATATILKIGKNGEIQGQERASHPIGTTIRVVELFDLIPVRKQTASKASAKILSKIKGMIQAYAFARPAVRFSVRVLKAKNNKADWTYAPKTTASVEDAAFKIVGKACASQCAWNVLDTDQYEIQAFLPVKGADCTKIGNVGQFISIDSRPVSPVRGPLKQVVTLFKEKVRACSPSLQEVKDPFLWMNIKCPFQSYDPNVEPAKDDVVFEDAETMLKAVRLLLESCYPLVVAQTQPANILNINDHETFNTLEIPDDADGRPPKRRRILDATEDGVDWRNPEEELSITNGDEMDEGHQIRDVNVSNPWVVAKLNSSLRPRRRTSIRNGQVILPLQERDMSRVNSQSTPRKFGLPPHSPWDLPTPEPSSSPCRDEQDIGMPSINKLLGINSGHQAETDSSLEFRVNENKTDVQSLTVRREVLGNANSVRCKNNELPAEDAELQQRGRRFPRYTGWRAINDFVKAGQLPLRSTDVDDTSSAQMPYNTITEASEGQRPARVTRLPQYHNETSPLSGQKPLPSVRDPSATWFDHLSSPSTLSRVSAGKRQQGRRDQDIREVIDRSLGSAKPRATPGSDSTTIGSAATDTNITLEDDDDEPEPRIRVFKPTVPADSGSSVYKASHANSRDDLHPAYTTTRARLTRSRSANLPLERTPNGWCIQDVLVTLSTSISTLSTLSLQLRKLSTLDFPAWNASLPFDENDLTSSLLDVPVSDDYLEGWRADIVRFLKEKRHMDEMLLKSTDIGAALSRHREIYALDPAWSEDQA